MIDRERQLLDDRSGARLIADGGADAAIVAAQGPFGGPLAAEQFAAAPAERGPERRVLFEAFRHGVHAVLDRAARILILPAAELVALRAELLPGLHEPVGAKLWIGAKLRLQLHLADGVGGAAIGSLARDARLAREHSVEIVRRRTASSA